MSGNINPNVGGANNGEPNNGSNPDDTIRIDLDKPCRVKHVNIEGIHRSRAKLVGKMVCDIYQSNSVKDFYERCVRIQQNLMALGAFNEIEIQIKTPNKDTNHDVTFVFHEKSRITASIQTAMDEQNAHLNTKIASPNITGNFDSVQLSLKLNKRIYSGEFRYSYPLIPWRHLWAPVYSGVYSQYSWDGQLSGYDQLDKSILNQFDFRSLPQLKHSVSFDNVWRQIKSSNVHTTPIAIKEQCGHSVKSSIRHSMEYDNRMGGNFPYEGVMARLTNEITTNLVTNGAKFSRHEINVQLNQLLSPKYDLLCQLNILGGTLLRPVKYNICDKFFAGGPLTVRGFKLQGLGSNVNGHPLGDSSYLSAGLNIYSILPYTTPLSPINQYIRPHLFINTGTIGDLNEIGRLTNMDDVKRISKRFNDSLRWSCGFGLVMIIMRLRLELNYCIPIVAHASDMTNPGFQWGFGLHYT